MHGMLQKDGKKYLEHRYGVSSDKTFWTKFKAQCPFPILHVDYSENIKLAPKNEVQTAHFSGKQQTLHCTVHFKSNAEKDHEFIYHLSDDTTHDSVMTIAIIEDLLEKCPDIVKGGILIIRSDNSSTQFKSRFVFAELEKIAKKYGISIFWFYGAAGHGRGLVDAMSSFGCKGPLRKSIITSADEVFFNNAEEMHSFLCTHFSDDITKRYFLVDPEKNATKRRVPKKDRPQNPIPGSSKLHLVAVTPDGEWLTRHYLHLHDDEVMNLKIDGSDIAEVDGDYSAEAVEGEDDPQVIIDRAAFNGAKFEFLTPGSYVALYSGGQFEQFYLVEVIDKGISETNMEDDHGHIIPANHHFIIGSYYEKDQEKRDYVKYKKCKNFFNVFINIGEIACVNIDFDGSIMSKEEYVSTCREVLSI